MHEGKSALGKHELAVANQIVSRTAPGKYTARELHGPEWEDIIRKRAYGKWFKASVLHEDLPGVRLVGKKSNKALLYEVSATICTGAMTGMPVAPRVSKGATMHVV